MTRLLNRLEHWLYYVAARHNSRFLMRVWDALSRLRYQVDIRFGRNEINE